MEYFKLNEIRDAVRVLFRDRAVISGLWERKQASYWGIAILLFPSLVNVFLLWLGFSGGLGVVFFKFIFWPLLIPSFALAGMLVFLPVFVGMVFEKSVNVSGVFRVLSYSSVFMWVGVLPFLLVGLGLFSGYEFYNLLWYLGFAVILYIAANLLVERYFLDKKKVLLSLGASVVFFLLLNLFLGWILVGDSYRLFY